VSRQMQLLAMRSCASNIQPKNQTSIQQ